MKLFFKLLGIGNLGEPALRALPWRSYQLPFRGIALVHRIVQKGSKPSKENPTKRPETI